MSICLTTVLGKEGSIVSTVHQNIDDSRYGIEKGNFTSLCKGNCIGSPHHLSVISFCRKLPDDRLVMTRSVMNKVRR